MGELRKTLAFLREEFDIRLARVRERMSELGLDGLILHTPENICYLCGYHSPGYYFVQVLVIPARAQPVLITRALEQKNAEALSWLEKDRRIGYLDTDNPVVVIVGTLRDLGLERGRLGFELSGFSFFPSRPCSSPTTATRC